MYTGSARFVRKPEDLNLVLSIANSSEDMISMVAAGRGVWLASEIAVPAHLESVNYQRLEQIKRERELFVIWKKEAELPPAARQFITVLKEVRIRKRPELPASASVLAAA